MHCSLSVGLLILAIILLLIGGFADMTGRKRVFGLSSHHYWADSIFALVLSGWILLWSHVCNGKKM
jgi:MFS family permease